MKKRLLFVLLLIVGLLNGCFVGEKEVGIDNSVINGYDESKLEEKDSELYFDVKNKILENELLNKIQKKNVLEAVQGKFLTAPKEKIKIHNKIRKEIDIVNTIKRSKNISISEEEKEINILSNLLTYDIEKLMKDKKDIDSLLDKSLYLLEKSSLREVEKELLVKFINYFISYSKNEKILNTYKLNKEIQKLDLTIALEPENSISNSINTSKRGILKRGRNYVYNRSSAYLYLQNYAEVPNTNEYPNLTYIGGDCANFASQMIHAGGISMDSDWYLRAKKARPNTSPKSVNEFDESWETKNKSPWISAKYFKDYWSKNCYEAKAYYTDNIRDNMWYPYRELWIGDVLQLWRKGFWGWTAFHTLEVSGYYYNSSSREYDIYVAGHTSNYFRKSLKTVLKTYSGKDFAISFLKMKNGY